MATFDVQGTRITLYSGSDMNFTSLKERLSMLIHTPIHQTIMLFADVRVRQPEKRKW